jgi:elongation factor G
LLHEAVDEATIFPVLCGSATTPIGAGALADFICRVGPAPGDRGPSTVLSEGRPTPLPLDPDGPPVAFVFKTTIDDFVGQISYFKMLSGTLRADDHLVVSSSGAQERLHHLVAPVGRKHRSIATVTAGEIAAVAKLSGVQTGDTLTDGSDVRVEPPSRPVAVYGVAIAAAAQADEDRLATNLRRLLSEDPTLTVEHHDDTQQTVLSGGGEMHVRVALTRLGRANIEMVTDDVRVAYRETFAGSVETEGKYKKQSGGHGQFGVATVRFEPLPRGAGFQFDSEVAGRFGATHPPSPAGNRPALRLRAR